MSNQHLYFRPITSETLHCFNFTKEILFDVVVFDDASGLRGWFVTCTLSSRFRGTVFDPEFLELVLINGNANSLLQASERYVVLPGKHTDKRDKLSLLSVKSRILNNPVSTIQHKLVIRKGEIYLAENVRAGSPL